MAKAPAVTKQRATALATTSFSDDLADLKSRIAAPSGDGIKVVNKQFVLPDGSKTPNLVLVIVDFVYKNSYYVAAYQKDVIVPADCMSLHPDPKGAIPTDKGGDIQHTDCDSCPQNQFKSKGAGKACQNHILIAVLPADATESSPMAILSVPPTSIKGFSNYVSSVASTLQRPPYGVITHVECDPDQEFTRLIFSDPQLFDMESEEDAATVNLIRSRRAEARERLMTVPDLTAANNTAPAKKTSLKAPVRRRA